MSSVTYSDFTLLSVRELNWSEGKFQSLDMNPLVETGEIPNFNYLEKLSKIKTCVNI